MRQYSVRWLTAAVAALGLATACNREAPTPNAELRPEAGQAVEGARDDIQDAWITTKIQAKYFADADVKARRIDVTTDNGVVTLRGSVDNERAREQAISIATNTDGVVRVNDQLGEQTAATTGTSSDPQQSADRATGTERAGDAAGNAWIMTKIQGKYFTDGLVKGRRIDVSANNGVVTLTGTVESEQEKQKAVELARNTEGVRRVEDRLQVAAGAEAGATATGGSTPAAGTLPEDRGFTEQMSDAGITARIQSKFFLNDTVKSRNIDVDTSGGVVTLAGQVGNDAEQQEAISLARSVSGVKGVKNQLRVVNTATAAPEATSAPAERSTQSMIEDPWITTKIQSSYFMDDAVKAGQIGVTTNQGVVTLTGEVPSANAKERAETIARQTEGVTQVENRLTVGPSQTQTSTPPPVPPSR